MQILLLIITILLAVILYRMLSSQRVSYPFIRTTRIFRAEDNTEYTATEAEEGMITIDHDMVIVEGQEYSLKNTRGNKAQAFLNIEDDKLISISIRLEDGEKSYFIDPTHNLYPGHIGESVTNSSHQQSHILAF